MLGLTSVAEVERYICKGCGTQVVVAQVPIIGGPKKGQLARQKRGYVCWENEPEKESKLT